MSRSTPTPSQVDNLLDDANLALMEIAAAHGALLDEAMRMRQEARSARNPALALVLEHYVPHLLRALKVQRAGINEVYEAHGELRETPAIRRVRRQARIGDQERRKAERRAGRLEVREAMEVAS